MKVLAFVVSFVCLSSARHIKLSPDAAEVGVEREIKEHKFPLQLAEFSEDDKQSIKEFLLQLIEIYRPILEEENFGQDLTKPPKPFPLQNFLRPLPDGQGIIEPFPHKDFVRPLDGISSDASDGSSSESVEEGIVRPLPQKPFMPPPPSHTLPVELDREIEETFRPNHLMRPLEGELKDPEMMKPLLYKPFPHKDIVRPLDGSSSEIVEEGIVRPLPQKPFMPPLIHTLPVELDGEIEQTFRPNHLMRPLEGELKDPEMMKPLLYKPFPHKDIVRPLDGSSSEIVKEEIVRPLPQKPFMPPPIHTLPVELDGEIEQTFRPNHLMRPLEGELKDPEMMKPLLYKPFPHKDFVRPLDGSSSDASDGSSSESVEEGIVRPLPQKPFMPPPPPSHTLPDELDGEIEKTFRPNYLMRPLEGELKDPEMMKPLLYEPFPHKDFVRPLDGSSSEIVKEEIVRPLPQKPFMPPPIHTLPVELDGEIEQTFRPNHLMRPLEGELKDPDMMKPLPYKLNKQPQHSATVEQEVEKSHPQKHIMLPLYASGQIDV